MSIDAAAAGDAALVASTERWFLARGIPHFIEDYRAGEDVFTRTLPALGLIFLFEVLGATNLDWHWWQNALALAGGMAVIAGAWRLVNQVRGRRPWARPDQVGPVELAVFVVVPALLPLVFNGQPRAAAATLLGNVVLLGLVFLVASYGLIPMTRWALGQTVHQLGAVANLLGRALPLLLLLNLGLFLSTEVWQVAASLDGGLFFIASSVFVVSGLVFLLARLPGEMRRLRDQIRGDGLVEACADTPVAGVAAEVSAEAAVEPLTRRQQGNVLLVLLFSQAVQVLLVTVTIGLFFFALGLVAIRPEVLASWLGPDLGSGVLVTFDVLGHQVEVTRALIHVSGLVAVISGFFFTVYVITDATYREEFFEEIVGQVRQSLAVRTVYLAVRARDGLRK